MESFPHILILKLNFRYSHALWERMVHIAVYTEEGLVRIILLVRENVRRRGGEREGQQGGNRRKEGLRLELDVRSERQLVNSWSAVDTNHLYWRPKSEWRKERFVNQGSRKLSLSRIEETQYENEEIFQETSRRTV